MKDIFIHGVGHGRLNGKLWGYIDNKGNIIIEPKYFSLSYFNDQGYAYGIQLIKKEGYNDQSYTTYNRKVVYYIIDKNGKEEEISETEYYKNSITKPDKKDENITIKENLDKKIDIDIEYILLESIIPLIIALVAIIIIKKMIKKEEKSDSSNIK